MAAPKNHPRYGGRVKGIPNKKTQSLIERCDDLGVDPFDVLLRVAKGDWEALGYDSPTNIIVTKQGSYEQDVITLESRVNAAKELCQYLYPKRKAIELSGDVDLSVVNRAKELESMDIKELEAHERALLGKSNSRKEKKV